jgi:hypothetical protein
LEQRVQERTTELMQAKASLEVQVLERTAKLREANEKLQNQMAQLEMTNKVMMGREERVLELKEEVNALMETLGKEKKYGR